VPDPDPAPVPEPDPTPPGASPEPEPDPDPLPPLIEPAPFAGDRDAPPADPASLADPAAEPPGTAPLPDAASAQRARDRRPCPDRLSPRSSFRPHRHPIHARRGSIHFRGIAWERGCGAIARVTVAIARREGGGTGRCRYLQPSGRIGRVVSCRRPTYVRARGTAIWSFRLRGRFPRGTWTARIRAVDRAGNSEKKVLKPNPLSRNFVTFKIR
jgi:hypothetical protein